jgi:hypothetical protein
LLGYVTVRILRQCKLGKQALCKLFHAARMVISYWRISVTLNLYHAA